jgi:hypothetical protein
MSHTRAELDRKITRLEAKAREMTPRELTRRYVPEYFAERVIGGILTIVGLRLAWGMRRQRVRRRQRLQAALGGYSGR